MDHRISKDMISSGMTPSGEKTQADLGRTQYGSAPSPSSLMDAYKAIYEHHQKDADGNVIPHEEKEELKEGKMPEGLKNYLMKKKGKKEDKKEDMKKEGVDLFDLVKGKLIDEGCEEKEAVKIMANLKKEEFEELSELALGTAGAIAGTAALAGMGINAIRKMNQNKKKMEQGGQFKKGSTMDNIQKKNQMLKNLTNN